MLGVRIEGLSSIEPLGEVADLDNDDSSGDVTLELYRAGGVLSSVAVVSEIERSESRVEFRYIIGDWRCSDGTPELNDPMVDMTVWLL